MVRTAPNPGDRDARRPAPRQIDPREPDYSRPGIFAHHNCWKCSDGAEPCAEGSPSRCDYPRARND